MITKKDVEGRSPDYVEGFMNGIVNERKRIQEVLDNRAIECHMHFQEWWVNLKQLETCLKDFKHHD